MKPKIIPLLILCFFYVSPLYANYLKLNKAMETYTPPKYYTDSLGQPTEDTHTITGSILLPELVLSRIRDLKLAYGKEIQPDHGISFLSGIDPATFNKLAAVASDPEIVKQMVSDRLRLTEIEIFSGLRNPSVLAAQKKVRAELESFSQVMDLDENLKQYSAFTEGIYPGTGPLKMKSTMKQTFPFPGLTALKGRIIHQQVAELVEKMRIVQKNIITEARNTYWDRVFIEDSIRVTKETIDAFDRLKNVATILYKSGKTSFQDIIKINIKIEVLKENLVTLSSRRKNIEVKLIELLNLPLQTRLGDVMIIEPNHDIPEPETLYPLARANRQELNVIRYRINKIQNMIEMAESMIQEPFTLEFSTNEDEAVNSVGTGASKTSFPEKTMASMKNNRPLQPWYGIDDPWLNQTRQTLLSLKQTLIEQENASVKMVREAWFMADKNNREFYLYKNRILPLSKSALDVSTREYEAGSIPFSQAIDSYTYWLRVKLRIAKEQTDLGRSLAALEKMIGSRL